MNIEGIALLTAGCIISAILIIISVMLMLGHLGILLAGYNFEAKGEKAVRCERYFLKRVGFITLIFSILFLAFFILLAFDIKTAANIMLSLSIIELFIGAIVANINKKMKRAVFLAKRFTENEDYEDEFSQYDEY